MILLSAERCDGCGACVEVCPNGALYLVDGKATLDRLLCRDCELCIAACPTGAITFTTQGEVPVAEPARMPAIRPEPAVIQIRTEALPQPMRTRVLPLFGATLAWAGRELVPRLADYLLDGLDSRMAQQSSARGVGDNRCNSGGGGRDRRRHRHRRRRRGA